MCGIVGYFGSTGNRLTRVLTGMTSIIYRAPDSTGIGWFGDELEPIRVRKALGSVTGLIKILLSEQAYLNQAGMLLELSTSRDESLSLFDLKKRLLTWEGFHTEKEQIIDKREQGFPTFDDLIALNRSSPIRVGPGFCGRLDSLPEFSITSAQDLVDAIKHLMQGYDISPVVTKTLILNDLSRRLENWTPDLRFRVEPVDILEEFGEIFDHLLREGELPVPIKNPYASRHLWKLLKEITVTIPLDYDTDGVRGLFRLLDASLLCRMSYYPELRFAMQKKLKKIWPESEKRGPVEWMTLYQAEKRVNIYGWAAAAGLAYLQEEEFLPKLKKEIEQVTEEGKPNSMQSINSVMLGHTDPMSLRFFSSPTISHGRWAMQSPVTIRNTHPFFDRTKKRIVVLNGQFNGEVETELHEFLLRMGLSFQSENSSEYMSLLWGYYFDVFTQEQKHSETVRVQIDAGLKDYSLGSQNIDYRVYSWIKGKTEAELDELAFIEAARKIVSRGGQIAVSGMSLVSPRKIYIAVHNRPVFIARRSCNEDVMVVSDINAAMGLFSQSMILEKTRELKRLIREHGRELSKLRSAGAAKTVIRTCKEAHKSKEAALLEAFNIYVLPLVGEEGFARIETVLDGSEVRRRVQVTNFDGDTMPEVEEFETILNPLQPEKEIFKSFYESHLQEIPERLNDILSIYTPEEGILPHLDVKDRYLRRCFGSGLSALKRIILVGMGSSNNVGLMAKSLFHKLLPQMNIVILRPVEVEQISNAIDPEKDLVVLLSWSGTTAEMVEFAKDLNKCKAAMIGITGKPFSDMALIAKKSAGVITVFSGEEVTFSAIKSPLCLLFCANLLAVWLAS
ncbi:MAG: SIS domain-containing protein, partial [Spirochaeta sp.]|nr:SIS domain-containing protein [Spirochaeta sp.]